MLCDLILMAMYLMTNDFLERRQVAATEIRKEEERIETIARMEDPSRQFQEMQRTGLQATRKPMALSILAKGLDEKLPVTVTTARPLKSGRRRCVRHGGQSAGRAPIPPENGRGGAERRSGARPGARLR